MTKLLRFRDLQDRGIIPNWPTLKARITRDGFPRHRAPKCTVDALMFTLRQHGVSALQCGHTRQHGVSALQCGHTRQRITELSDDQIESVVTRLSRLRGTYTKITDDLLLALAELLDG